MTVVALARDLPPARPGPLVCWIVGEPQLEGVGKVAGKMAHILVVDDDDAVRGTMRRILERAGHTVEVASNGIDGVRLFRVSQHDLVVTDLYMPEKEGIEVIQDLRAEFPDARILAVSGGVMGDRSTPLVDAELFGANASLAKPFTPEQLQAVVAKLLLSDQG